MPCREATSLHRRGVACGTPWVTVVVPVFNEAHGIACTLEALLDQSHPRERYEVVVVDNGSTDGTRGVVADYPVRLLREPRRSSYAARNAGIESTAGDWLAFIDSDCVAEPDWLANLLSCASSSGAGLVAGRIELEPPAQPTLGSRLLALRFSSQIRRRGVENEASAPGGNLLVRREVFEACGLFEVLVSGADSAFTQAAARNGYKLAFAEDALVKHPGEISNSDYLRRGFRLHYGKGSRRRDEPGILGNQLRALPWRPALRLPPELRSSSSWQRLVWRHYLWLDRLARWAGALAGILGIPYKGDRH